MATIAIAFVVFLASAFGTATGFGTSTILFPFLLLFFPFQEMLLFVAVLHLATDLWKIVLFRTGIRWDLIIAFGAAGMLAGVAGAELSFSASEELLSRILGLFLIGYAYFAFRFPTWHLQPTRKNEIAGGALSGFFAGIFGIGGPERAAVLNAYQLPKSVYIVTTGVIGVLIDIPRIGIYLIEGATIPPMLRWGMLLFIPITFAGAWVAHKYAEHMPEQRFRYGVLAALALIGAKLLLFG